jgi:hypothetical protein
LRNEEDPLLSALSSAGVDTYNDNGRFIQYGSVNSDVLVAKIPKGYTGTDLIGGSGNDSLKATTDGNILMDGSGNDTLNGGSGNDQFTLPNGVGQDTIIDSGTSSYILANGQQLKGWTSSSTNKTWSGNTWTDNDGTTYTFIRSNPQSNTGTLKISDGVLQSGSITIPNFNLNTAISSASGYLGIHRSEACQILQSQQRPARNVSRFPWAPNARPPRQLHWQQPAAMPRSALWV